MDRFKQVSEWVAKAGDAYMEKNVDSGLTMGIIDKLLRKQGLQADAVSIEIAKKNIKLIILVPDDQSEHIEVVCGNKNGDIYSSFKEPFATLSEEKFLDILNIEFAIQRD